MLTAPDGRIFSANKSACDMLERTEEEIQHVGRDGVVDLNDPRLAMSLEERQRTGKSVGERVFVRKDGSKFPCDVSSTMYSDKDGNLRTSVIFRDITERKRVENALQESEARMSAVFQSSPLGIVISKIADGTILDINDATLHLFGYSREEVVGQRTVADLGAYVNPAQRDEMMKLLRQQGSVQNLHIEYRTRNDKHMVLEVSGRIVILRGESCLLAMMGDVTQRIQAEVKVHEQAFRDSLTRLPNRRLLKDRLQQSIAVSRRSACYGALMFVDLDNFKPLNDTHGHEVGDLLLIEAANRLNGCVREMDTVARLGGDEFVVVLNELNSELLISTEQAQAVAEKIRHELSGVYLLVPKTEGAVNSGIEHRCTASIGVALFGVNHASSSQEVLKWADEAMYQAKHAGRNSVRFYEPS
jgi:diguanylate cyclase (GGDEF)-like protein/PAS domain S-box-containing protein